MSENPTERWDFYLMFLPPPLLLSSIIQVHVLNGEAETIFQKVM